MHEHVKGFSSKRTILKVDSFRTGKYAACRRMRALFSPEVLQAGAVKRLKRMLTSECLVVLRSPFAFVTLDAKIQ